MVEASTRGKGEEVFRLASIYMRWKCSHSAEVDKK
jgi:hypothetical protein